MPAVETLPPPALKERMSFSQLRSAFQNVGMRVGKRTIESYNFVTGSAGWQINANGDVEFSDGTFRGAISASTVDIGGADATSIHVDIDGNFWLGASTFSAAPFKIANTGAVTITGTGLTTLFSITSPAANIGHPLEIYQQGADTQGAIYVECSDSGAGAKGVDIIQNGDKSGLFIQNAATSAGYGLEFNYLGTAAAMLYGFNNSAAAIAAQFINNSSTNSADVVQITQNGTARGLFISITGTGAGFVANALEINNDGRGRGFYLHCDNTNMTAIAALIENNGSGVGLRVENQKASGGDGVLELLQSTVTSTNFRKYIYLDSIVIWTSNGTTPNGNLSGNAGDICLNGPSGQPFFCTGTTSWTAM